ncbi:endo-glucanase RCE3 [Achlya hypogyna]|uniref:Endo-glucanase RCE3 n=1 Tax=Achlya hypogyna TaxID=1202772 RepID=A0A0A7CNZ8_ACHHY|nr:secreted protein [Achlya hypogyna]OQR85756.1 endo-glucanase RCE3 [Achlya hypogyna]
MKTAAILALVAPTAVVVASKQCAEKYSQCNGQNWPLGVCCKDPSFSCNYKNQYLSLCEPKKEAMDVQAASVSVWGKCGGKGYNGDTTCAAGSTCVKLDDWYSQCQPTPAGPNELATWAQCGGTNNNFQANGKTCRAADKCFQHNSHYWQCIPKAELMAAEATEVDAWGQCGGKNYNGDTTCAAGNSCVKVDDWYSQCQPTPAGPNEIPTWSQCGGSLNNFNANGKTCRSSDECKVHNSYYWQCTPKK